MDIKALLPSSHVVLRLSAETREEAWRQLCQPLLKDGILTDVDAFVDDLANRENQVTTRVDGMIALPHARSNNTRRLGVVLGLSPERTVEYSGDSPGPAVIFLLAVPAFAPTAHLPALQRFARFAQDSARVAKLLNAGTPSQAARLVANFKG
jgi:mannitol/fructose-specific phosphotransferase system IIA component (Ntr-type)